MRCLFMGEWFRQAIRVLFQEARKQFRGRKGMGVKALVAALVMLLLLRIPWSQLSARCIIWQRPPKE